MKIFKNKKEYIKLLILKLLLYVKYSDTLQIIAKALAISYDGCNNIREHDRLIRKTVFDAKYRFVLPELPLGTSPSDALDFIYAEANYGNQKIKSHPLYRAMIQLKDSEIRSIRYILKIKQ
jgi:hypothetical protein